MSRSLENELRVAARRGHTETVTRLVERHGANVEARAYNGQTALQMAEGSAHAATAAEIRRLQDQVRETRAHDRDAFASDPSVASTNTTNTPNGNNTNSNDDGHPGFRPDFSQLDVGDRLGEGSFGVVHRGTWDGTEVAVKFVSSFSLRSLSLDDRSAATGSSSELDPSFIRESNILSGLRHPHIVQFLGVSPTGTRSDPRPCIVTEFCARGSLSDVLGKAHTDEATARALTWSRRLKMALEAAKGMLYLHRLRPIVLHRDLKSPNLLITDNWSVKVRGCQSRCR